MVAIVRRLSRATETVWCAVSIWALASRRGCAALLHRALDTVAKPRWSRHVSLWGLFRNSARAALMGMGSFMVGDAGGGVPTAAWMRASLSMHPPRGLGRSDPGVGHCRGDPAEVPR